MGAQIPALMLLGLVLALTASSAASAAPTTQTFPFNGNSQFFTIPGGVTSVQITVQGGSGGMGYPTVGGGIGGAGAQITGTVAVTPGEPWEIDVGGAGGGGTAPGASCFFNDPLPRAGVVATMGPTGSAVTAERATSVVVVAVAGVALTPTSSTTPASKAYRS